jgi:ADP-heptose:LPS heptosyltransferase
MTRILVKRAGALGDVIMTTGVVRALHEKHNGACEIDVLTQFPKVFERNPYVTNLGESGTYEQVIDLDLAYELRPNVHTIQAYADKAGVDPAQCRIEMFPSEADRAAIANAGLPEKFVCVHMRNHFWPNRNLPNHFWMDVMGHIIGQTDMAVVQVGGGNDLQFGDIPGKMINTVNKLSLHQSVALFERSTAYIGVDSGSYHIAACTDVPIVGLFTAFKSEYREPIGRNAAHVNIAANIDCYGCAETMPAPIVSYKCNRGDEACTRSFNPTHVYSELMKLLEQ